VALITRQRSVSPTVAAIRSVFGHDRPLIANAFELRVEIHGPAPDVDHEDPIWQRATARINDERPEAVSRSSSLSKSWCPTMAP